MLSRGSTGGKYPPGKWVWMRTVSGHRDAGYTDCPGGNLYALLPDIRSGAYAIGLPKIFRPTQSRRAFTPVKESVTWGAYASEEVTWTVQVTDVSGAVVRSWTSSGKTLSLTWNGQNALGVPVPEGRYRVRIAARSTADARPAAFTVEVEPLLPSALALSRARPRPPVNRAGEP